MCRVNTRDQGHGDHGLLLIADKSANLRSIDLSRLDSLAQIGKHQGVWVLDPWSNFGCHASDYPKLMREKCWKWQKEGKVVIRKTDTFRIDAEGRAIISRDPKLPLTSTYDFGKEILQAPMDLHWLPTRLSPEQQREPVSQSSRRHSMDRLSNSSESNGERGRPRKRARLDTSTSEAGPAPLTAATNAQHSRSRSRDNRATPPPQKSQLTERGQHR
jgi:hypothetical protein